MPVGVQIKGIGNVVDMFTNRKCNAWSIWVGKQFLFSCVAADPTEAAAELNNILEALDKDGKCVYTLKVYDELIEGFKIKEKTEADGSLNFRLNEQESEDRGRMGSVYDDLKACRAEIATLKEELENVEPDEDESIMGRIGNMLLEDPAKLPLMLQSLQSVIGMFIKQTTATGQPVAIGAVPGNDPLQTAIDTLKKYDPKLTQHLTKLASLAQNDPSTFKILLSTLDSM